MTLARGESPTSIQSARRVPSVPASRESRPRWQLCEETSCSVIATLRVHALNTPCTSWTHVIISCLFPADMILYDAPPEAYRRPVAPPAKSSLRDSRAPMFSFTPYTLPQSVASYETSAAATAVSSPDDPYEYEERMRSRGDDVMQYVSHPAPTPALPR